MNDRMWAHPQVRRNADAAREIGYHVLDPDNGALAAGKGSGPGRMPEPETILAHCARLLEAPTALEGRRIVVTAGPTREPIDPVRFLSNRSSGKMGIAIALIMAAAPADFAAAESASAMIKKAALTESLALTRTDDILATTRGARSTSCVTAGFALETGEARSEARRKLADKGLDLVVANNALEDGAGFSVDTNRVTIAHADGREENLPLQSKTQVADEILDRVEVLLHGR
jgi:phosphopantothenoylcysteine decarboxylase/phosphopantothenate--cysteine ligase